MLRIEAVRRSAVWTGAGGEVEVTATAAAVAVDDEGRVAQL